MVRRHTGAPVLLDACVLIPAALRDTLLRAAQQGLYRPGWSEDILAEVLENLVENGLADRASAERLVSALRLHFPRALIGDYATLVSEMRTRDPGDRHVLAAAVVARAELIVTSNLRDFPVEATEAFGIEAWHPDAFLTDLLMWYPQQMRSIIATQAAALKRPPLTVEEVLDRLARDAPTFVARFRGETD
jgi:predicted nucleic acid-binding protein